MLATYGARIKLFMTICDARGLPENARFPISQDLLAMFLAQLVGTYSSSAARNYVAGLKAWHVVHCLPWAVDYLQINTLLQAATLQAPVLSQQSKKKSYTIETLALILPHLSPETPLDTAVAAVATILFYALGQTGELTVPRQDSFQEDCHVHLAGLSSHTDRGGNRVTTIHVPRTKVSVEGESIYWAKQEGPTDPDAALANHRQVNNSQLGKHLFAYSTTNKRIPLTKKAFLARFAAAAKAANTADLKGHAFQVGGTLEYLLQGVPFEVVKSHRQWKGDVFQLYLRKHAQIVAPYIQAQPDTHASFVQLVIPQTR
jgi:hypothetical protein